MIPALFPHPVYTPSAATRRAAPMGDGKHLPPRPSPAAAGSALATPARELRSRSAAVTGPAPVPAPAPGRRPTGAGALDCLGLFRRETPSPRERAARIVRSVQACMRPSCWRVSPIQSGRLERLARSLGASRMSQADLAAFVAGLASGPDEAAVRLATRVFLRALHPGTMITPAVFDRLLVAVGSSGILLMGTDASAILGEGVRALAPPDRPARLGAWFLSACRRDDATAKAQAQEIVLWARRLECAGEMAYAVAAVAAERRDRRPLDLLRQALAELAPRLPESRRDNLAGVPEALDLLGAFLPAPQAAVQRPLPGQAAQEWSRSSFASEVTDEE